jgi:hypothetical protein
LSRLTQLRRNACDKDAFLSAFSKPILCCVLPPHGDACPRNFNIDVTCARAYVTLGELDARQLYRHERDVFSSHGLRVVFGLDC